MRYFILAGLAIGGLGLLAACESSTTAPGESELLTAPEMSSFQLTAKMGCPEGFSMESAKLNLDVDRNGDGAICVKKLPNGRLITVDNNVPFVGECPPNFKPKDVADEHEADLNKNKRICKRVADDGTVFLTDDFFDDDEAG